MAAEPLLAVRELEVDVSVGDESVTIVRGVDLEVRAGSTLAIVGESGAGKTLSALAMVNLLSSEFSVKGSIRLDGLELSGLTPKEWEEVRGAHVGFVFQDAMGALNPLMPVGKQIAEVAQLHLRMGRDDARQHACELLAYTGIPDPEVNSHKYPHALSGGMRQRVLIAIALAARPRLLIADEPTSSLDVTVQAQILGLFKRLSQDMNMASIVITHDLGIVAGIASDVAVMYAGKIVEYGSAKDVIRKPRHPYTQGLMQARPKLNVVEEGKLFSIEGVPPLPKEFGDGCAFAPRCSYSLDICFSTMPRPESVSETGSTEHVASCFVRPTQPVVVTVEGRR